MASDFTRDRLTWACYLLVAWFAYLQAAPGLVIGHLRHELGLSYFVGGLHVAAFAGGSMVAGLVSGRVERALGRSTTVWSAAALLSAGTVALAAGRSAGVTVGSVLVMGVGGGLVLSMVQATLADRHGERRAVALAEANVAASVAYLLLIGGLSITVWLHVGWRVALLTALVVPLVLWGTSRRLEFAGPDPSSDSRGRLPQVFWVAAAMLFCTTAAEWSVTAWGATYVEEASGVSADAAVTLMGGYFCGVLAGRLLGSRLTRRHEPVRLLALALAVAALGFAVLWPASTAAQAVAGLALLGIGLGNLFPMVVSVAVSLAPDLAGLASGRAVAVSAFSVLLAPLVIGTLSDATSLRAALLVVPLLLAVSAAALVAVGRRNIKRPGSPAVSR